MSIARSPNDRGQELPKVCFELLKFLADRSDHAALVEEVPATLRREEVIAICEGKQLVRKIYSREETLSGDLIWESGSWLELTGEGFAFVAEQVLRVEEASRASPTGSGAVLTSEEQALGLLVANPGITKKEIAQRLGIHPSGVSRMKKLTEAIRAMKSGRRIPRGSKTSDGQLEASDEDDDG